MNRPLRTPLVLVLLTLAAGSCAPPPPAAAAVPPPAPPGEPPPGADATMHAALRAAIVSPDRPAKDRARDVYRHPVETLEFFGLRPGMTVVELWAGSGWYSAILAPALAGRGRYIATNFDPGGPESGYTNIGRGFDAFVRSNPKLFAKAEVHAMHWPDDFALGPDGSADMVLTFRNFHNWIRDGIAQRMVAAAARALKTGGIFGVVEHRARPDADPAASGKTGYVPEAYVIGLCETEGLKLEARSEINANPKDTKDWPAGVWTLPPALRLGPVDRDKYLAIGESDRMTLRFVRR